MNSVLEYVRQLNQQSVTLRNEWLDRLRHVECDPGAFSLAPEIELTKKSVLRGSDSTTHEAPVTVVTRSDSGAAHPDNINDSKRSGTISSGTNPPATDSTLPAAAASSAPFSPMDRLRELLGEELHVFGGPYDSTSRSEPTGSKSVPKQVSVETDIKSVQAKQQSFVPSPHVSIRAKKPFELQELHELRSAPDDDTTGVPVASVPYTNEPAADSDVDPLRNEALATTRNTGHVAGQPTKDSGSDPSEMPVSTCQMPGPTNRSLPAATATGIDETQPLKPRSIDKITDQLLARFPAVASTTVMFASLTPGIDVDNIAAKVATCLANRDLGGILLVDGNSRSRSLSAMMASHRAPGFSELVNRTEKLSSVVCATDNANLEFLPFGNSDVTHRRFDSARATALGKEFNQTFQFTIVSGGVIVDSLVSQWAGYVDAVYLLVDLATADRQATINTLTVLRHHAVRIAGIIAVEDEIRIL